MKDELYLGCVPPGEDCAQLGKPGYWEKAKIECSLFIEVLKKQFGNPPQGTNFKIKSNPHDFGTYLDVVVQFQDDNEESVAYAFLVEGDMLEFWPDEVKEARTLNDALIAMKQKNGGKKFGLADLVADCGVDEMEIFEDAMCDGVCPAICTECGYTTEMEPDQDRGYCETCGKNTVKSALILGGMI